MSAAAEPAGALLDARLVVRRPGFTLDLTLRVAAGEVVALLGPNGSGKTTALRALAGLTALSAGHVRLAGRPLHALPAERRPVGMVFQDYLLFPHLSVLENVAFGPRCRGAGRRAARDRAGHWLKRVGLADRAADRPGALSGGQAQRVALARALAAGPEMLLLDEPMAALDAGTRMDIRAALRRHLTDFGGAAVLVTHDPLDAMSLADRLVVVEEGRAVQQGPPAEVAGRPRTGYVARLVGLNLFRGAAHPDGVVRPEGAGLGAAARPGAADPGFRFDTTHSLTGEVFVAFAPAAVSVFRTRPDGSPRNLWRTRVAAIESHGDRVRLRLAGPPEVIAEVTARAVAELGLVDGSFVWAAVKATEIQVYPA